MADTLNNVLKAATDTATNAVNYVSETIQQGAATASKETNKEVAKDNDASLGTRATAAKDALSDKLDENKHDAKAEVNEQRLKN